MLLQLHIYIRKIQYSDSLYDLKNLFWATFCQKIAAESNLSLYIDVTSSKKKAKTKPKIKSKTRQKKKNSSIHWFLTKPANSFWAHFEPHKLFPWKHDFVEMYNSYAVVTLCKISQKFQTLISYKTWKTLFWALFGPLLA